MNETDANALLDSLLDEARTKSLPVEHLATEQNPEALAVDYVPLIIDGIPIPREAAGRIRSMTPAERRVWDEERYRARTDPIYLANEVCSGMELQENPHRMLFADLLTMQPGTPLADLDKRYKKKMVLWQRELGKTSCAKIFELQLILNYPQIRISFMTGSDTLAVHQLEALKTLLQNPSDKLKDLFPEFVLISKFDKKTKEWHDVSPDWGNQHEFNVPCRTSRFAEPTVSISTPRSVQSGAHYEIIFIDDLVNNQNFRNGAAMHKCYQDYLQTIPLLTQGGYVFLTGTRYVVGDTYQMIIEHAEEVGELSNWKFSIRNCWSKGDCIHCGHAEVFHDSSVNILEGPCRLEGCTCPGYQSNGVQSVLFPQIIKADGQPFGCTLESLARVRAESGQEFFACQYENNPLAAGTQTFTDALLGQQTLHHRDDIIRLAPPHQSTIYIVGDLAYSTGTKRDRSVLFAFSKFAGQLFVWGCVYGRWTASERVANILGLVRNVRPQTVYFEKNLNSDSLQLALEARMIEFGLGRLPIQWLPVSNAKDAKATRIAEIEGWLKARRIWLLSSMDGYDILRDELLKFPHASHDDFADALSQVVAAPTGFQSETPPRPEKPKNWLERLHNSDPVDEVYYDRGGGSGLCM